MYLAPIQKDRKYWQALFRVSPEEFVDALISERIIIESDFISLTQHPGHSKPWDNIEVGANQTHYRYRFEWQELFSLTLPDPRHGDVCVAHVEGYALLHLRLAKGLTYRVTFIPMTERGRSFCYRIKRHTRVDRIMLKAALRRLRPDLSDKEREEWYTRQQHLGRAPALVHVERAPSCVCKNAELLGLTRRIKKT